MKRWQNCLRKVISRVECFEVAKIALNSQTTYSLLVLLCITVLVVSVPQCHMELAPGQRSDSIHKNDDFNLKAHNYFFFEKKDKKKEKTLF